MTYRKKLIEVALPLEAINEASAREKSIRHGHPSTLHLWWARRPLAACRAVIFASLVDDPGHHPEDHDDPVTAPPEFIEACRKLPKGKNASGADEKGRSNDTPRMRLFDFIETLVQWESTTDERILETACKLILLATDGNPPPLLDPFAGGGSIPLEAQRLGLEAHASDLNPVAVMINKALIEIPPKFANMPPVNPRDRQKMGSAGSWKGASGLAADVRYYGGWMRDKAREQIGHLYPDYNGETVIAWLWARTVKCPNPACGAMMPLVSSFELSKKKGRRAWVEPQIDLAIKTVRFTVKTGVGTPPDPPKVGRGAKFRCLVCKEIPPDQHIYDEGLANRLGAQLMAVVAEGNSGRSFYAPTPEHEEIVAQAKPGWQPRGQIPYNPRYMAPPLYGMTDFSSLFTLRQLTALTTFSDLVADARQQIEADARTVGVPIDDTPLRDGGRGARAYAETISVYLAFALDKMTDTNTALCSWQNIPPRLRATFGRQALPMVWDFAESNPFGEVAGDYALTIDSLCRVLEKLIIGPEGTANQVDASNLNNISGTIHISTDPPYYDNIGYADLSDFFYVWMRKNLSSVFPELFGTMLVPKEPELIASPYRFDGNKTAAEQHFEAGLNQAFSRMRRVIQPDYPLTVYYAFKQQEIVVEEGAASTGWETMLEGLIASKFQITGTWPIRTELSTRNVASGTNALASSIVLVCRPRPENAPMTSRREFVNALRRELPAALQEMQSGNIAPVDLAQASIGPGMAVYSRYSKVLEPNGQRLTVRAALQLINHELDAYLAEQEGDIDADSRFAVSWFEQFGFKEAGFGQADVLARAKNTSVEGLANAGVLASGAGKVRLLHWSELDPGWDPATDKRLTVWEAAHHLIQALDTRGEAGAARLLAQLSPDLAAEARQLAYRLYSICERKGWAEYARDYNALVISWSASQEQAQTFREQYLQGRLL